jgi:hypothetical protein
MRDEGKHAAGRGLDDVFAKTGKGQHRGPALVDHGGHAGMNADGVGVEAEAAADVAIDVGVGVDQAGQHQFAPDVDRLPGGTREVPAYCRDPAFAHCHIENAVETLRRIDDAASPKQQIERRGLHDVHVGALAGLWRILLAGRRPDKGSVRRQSVATNGRLL